MGGQLNQSNPADPCNATLLARELLHPCLALLRVQPDAGRIEPFAPGQFLELGLPALPTPADANSNSPRARRGLGPRLTRRAYTIIAAPEGGATVAFLLARVEGGKLTPRLWEVPVGGRVWMNTQPKGMFTLAHVAPERLVLMIASGTGLAPFVSMWQHHAGNPPWRRCVLLHQARTQADLAYRRELTELAQADARLLYVPVLSREPDDSGYAGVRGKVTQLLTPDRFAQLTGEALDPTRVQAYLCGNPGMIEAARAALTPAGFVADADIITERYW